MREPVSPDAPHADFLGQHIMNTFEQAKFYFNEGVAHCLEADAQRSLPLSTTAFGLYQEAADCLDKAIATDSGHVVFWNVKAYVLRRMGRAHDAIMFLEKAIELDARFSENYYQVALCLFDLFLVDEALKDLEMAFSQSDDAETLRSRLCNDLHEILHESLFYFCESKKLGQFDDLSEMGHKLISLAEFAVSFLPQADVFPRLLHVVRDRVSNA